QARGRDSGSATDMYAFGCLLFALLAGRTPFEGDDRLAVGLRRAHEDAPSLSSCVADPPEDAVALVAGLLAGDPAARPTALDVLELLGVEPSAIGAEAANTV